MIKNQWYAILQSKDVPPGRVVGAKRLGMELVFYRDKKGEVCCASDRCPHRGAALSSGCMKDGALQCPFHGIRYGDDGKCVLIPSEGKSNLDSLPRFNLKTMPVREIGEIIFVWYGDGTPDREPDYFPVIEDRSFRFSHLDDHWKVHYSRVIENQLDVSHLAFVHRTTIGRGNRTLCNGPKALWLDDNTLQTSANNDTDTGQTPKPADECEIYDTNLTFKFPNMWLNHITDKILVLAYFVPVDDENSIISLRFYNRITGIKALDSFIAWFGKWANKVIERQDKRIVETQLPKASSLYSKENLVQADFPIMEYRNKREALKP